MGAVVVCVTASQKGQAGGHCVTEGPGGGQGILTHSGKAFRMSFKTWPPSWCAFFPKFP